MAEIMGLEPIIHKLCVFAVCVYWCGVTDSNRRPYACKAYALPAELTPHRQLSNMLQSKEKTDNPSYPTSLLS